MKNTTDFSLCVFNPRSESSAILVNKCYELWKNVWKETYKKLDNVDVIFADDFDRQDEIIALFHGGQPIALIMHRYRDLSRNHVADDTYFKCWPKSAVLQLARYGSRVVIGSHVTVHSDYRKTSQTAVPVKEIIVYASLKHLSENKNIDAVTGTMRVDKGMNNLFYNSGAVPLVRDLTVHNVPVDLVCFYPQRIPIQVPPTFIRMIENFKTNNQAIQGSGSHEHKKSA